MKKIFASLAQSSRLLQFLFGIIPISILVLCSPSEIFAFKPKTHIYAAIKAIQLIMSDENKVIINGQAYDADPEVCEAIRTVPAAYIAGVIGPDGFPDIQFGQTRIHPDSKCDYSSINDGDCHYDSPPATWSFQWLRHIFESAYSETGIERKKAIAFAYGYLTHAAGDMWAHTLVNQFAQGSWPDNLGDPDNLQIAIRHMVIEGIVGQHTPDIRPSVIDYDIRFGSDIIDGLDAPEDFVYNTLIENDWALERAEGTLIKMFVDLREAIRDERDLLDPIGWEEAILIALDPIFGSAVALSEVLIAKYLDCWIEEIDEGLRAWPTTSYQIASRAFIFENSDEIWDPVLKNFKDDHLIKMVGLGVPGIIADCIGVPELVIDIVNPAAIITAFVDEVVDRLPLLSELRRIKEAIRDYLFQQAFGMTYDEFRDILDHPESYIVDTDLFPAGSDALLNDLMHLKPSGEFDDETFSALKNTITLSGLILMNPENLDDLLFEYNVGSIYTNPSYTEEEKKLNIMLGFIRTLDGNHQWRKNAPRTPIMEANRRFSEGMPIWEDCLARNNFFRNIFSDWQHKITDWVYTDMVYADLDRDYLISSLPPVTTAFRLVNKFADGSISEAPNYYGADYLGFTCGNIFAEVTLINHQDKPQPFTIYVTMEASFPRDNCDGTVFIDDPNGPCDFNGRPLNTYFHEVVTGVLEPTTYPHRPVRISVPLKNCFIPVDATVKVYVLEDLKLAQWPILGYNSVILPDSRACLNDEVTSYYQTGLVILCQDCPAPEDCVPNPFTGQSGSIVTGPDSTTVFVPCIPQGCEVGDCDADNDEVVNNEDNCPLTANGDQADIDEDGVGDVCDTPPSLPDLLKDIFKRWAASRLPNEVPKSILENPRLWGGGEPPEPAPGSRQLFGISNAGFDKVLNQMKGYTKHFIAGQIQESEFVSNLRRLYSGIRYQAENLNVKKVNVQGSGRQHSLEVRLTASKNTLMRVYMPRFIFDAKSGNQDEKFVVLINRRAAQYVEKATKFNRVLEIKMPKGNKTLKITGTQLGPSGF